MMQIQSAIQQQTIGFQASQAQAPTEMITLPGARPEASEQKVDTVTISDEGKKKGDDVAPSAQTSSAETEDLTKEQLAALTKLQARDKEVRAHEQAHLAAAGGYATSGATFTFQKGPDGNSYAVGGEVGIDMSKETDPSATIEKMRAVKRAALAPANPSSVDRQIAAQATAKETQARKELVEEQEKLLESSAIDANNTTPSSDLPDATSDSSPSISSLKAIAAYERISAL